MQARFGERLAEGESVPQASVEREDREGDRGEDDEIGDGRGRGGREIHDPRLNSFSRAFASERDGQLIALR